MFSLADLAKHSAPMANLLASQTVTLTRGNDCSPLLAILTIHNASSDRSPPTIPLAPRSLTVHNLLTLPRAHDSARLVRSHPRLGDMDAGSAADDQLAGGNTQVATVELAANRNR